MTLLTNWLSHLLCILTAALKSWERNSGDPPPVKTKTATDFLSEICKPGGPVEEALNYLKAIGILPATTVSLYYPLVRFNLRIKLNPIRRRRIFSQTYYDRVCQTDLETECALLYLSICIYTYFR